MREGTYTLSSGYGPRWGEFHRGVDFAAPIGTPIYAAMDGVVVDAGPASGFGLWIVIDSNDGGPVSTVYGHMYVLAVAKGDKVRAGQRIADVGNNGYSTGPHLHFEVWPGGKLQPGGQSVDPQQWLARAQKIDSGPATVVALGADATPPALSDWLWRRSPVPTADSAHPAVISRPDRSPRSLSRCCAARRGCVRRWVRRCWGRSCGRRTGFGMGCRRRCRRRGRWVRRSSCRGRGRSGGGTIPVMGWRIRMM